MKTKSIYVTVNEPDMITGMPKQLQMQASNGDLKVQFLRSILRSGNMAWFPDYLLDMIAENYDNLLSVREMNLGYLKEAFCTLYEGIFNSIVDGAWGTPLFCDEDKMFSALAELKMKVGVGSYREPGTSYRARLDEAKTPGERAEVLRDLLETRHRLKSEIRRLNRLIDNICEWFADE